MNCRSFFLCPDRASASGGIEVIYDVVALLNLPGNNAAVLHDAGYSEYPASVPILHKKETSQNCWRRASLKVAPQFPQTQIFFSLLQHEPPGFPVAEAMVAGRIVIGFDGLGVAEYFDEKVLTPLAEGDAVADIETAEKAVAAYESHPAFFDEMRLTPPQRVNDKRCCIRNGCT